MKKMPARIYTQIKLFFTAIIVVYLFTISSSFAYAAPSPCPPDQAITEVGCLPTDPVAFVSSFYGIGLSLVGGVALIFIIIGAYVILTSRGNPTQVNVGKSYIFYAILGLLLAIFGYIFIEVFLVDILHIPGFSH
jgi:hypothetical protein